MNIELNKVFEVSARVAFALCVATVVLLFFPAGILPFDILSFREKYGFWAFLVLAFSVAILLSYLVKWIIGWIKKKIESRKMWKNYKYVFSLLSDEEKLFLKKQYDKKDYAIYINLSNPMHKHLETFRIISMAAGNNLGAGGSFPGFIQPWVFEYIDKHPQCLITEHKENTDHA